jgi:tetratricopeptide (TPR) repeat protein
VQLISGCQGNQNSLQNDLAGIELLRGDIKLCGNQQFGEVDFTFSCDLKSRSAFNRALSLLHSFEYEEAEKSFVNVIDLNPDCVMAYWGVAMCNFHELWLQKDPKALEKGSRILAAAGRLSTTEREKDYLDAIGVYYQDWDLIDHQTRVKLYEQKMEALHNKYPQDAEAAIFYALALTAAADPTDKSYEKQKRSGKILESIFPDQPDHPGIAHYIIHNYDTPELAEFALPTARRYAKIAPSSAHAQHMPSHIFTRLGLWEESISSNLQSTESALCYSQAIHPSGHWDEELHGMDYLVYAYLQIGANQKANDQLNYLRTFKEVFPENFKVAYAAAAIPSRIALENKDWVEASRLTCPEIGIDWKAFPWQRGIVHFTRALGLIHTDQVNAAREELLVLDSLHHFLLDKGETYQAGQLLIQRNIIQAWLYFSTGQRIEALALMQESAELEYGTGKHAVTPGEVLPAGELLGDMTLALNQPRQALEYYERDLTMHPNRFNDLYGAAMAAKASGDPQKARLYFETLLDISKNGDGLRPELLQATAYIRKKSG